MHPSLSFRDRLHELLQMCKRHLLYTGLSVLEVGLYKWLKTSNLNTNQVKEVEGGISLFIVLFYLPYIE